MAIDENIPLDEQEAGIEQEEVVEEGAEEEVGEQDETGEQDEEQEEVPPGEQAAGGEEEHATSRRANRVQKLANERAEAMAATKLAQEQAEFYRKQAEALQQQRTPPAEDVYQDLDEKWRKSVESQMNHALFSANDLNDKAAYTLQSAKNPLYAQYEARVEAQLQQVRAKGGNATRDGILKFLIGEDAVANAGKRTPAAKQAQQRVQQARGSTPAMRSNVAAPKNEKTAEDRLSGVIL